jgi:hypothetical protein
MEEGWQNRVYNNPFDIDEIPWEVTERMFGSGDSEDFLWVARSFIEWFERYPDQVERISEITGFPDSEHKWKTFIISHVLENTESEENLNKLAATYLDMVSDESFAGLGTDYLVKEMRKHLIEEWEPELNELEKAYRSALHGAFKTHHDETVFNKIKEEVTNLLNQKPNNEDLSVDDIRYLSKQIAYMDEASIRPLKYVVNYRHLDLDVKDLLDKLSHVGDEQSQDDLEEGINIARQFFTGRVASRGWYEHAESPYADDRFAPPDSMTEDESFTRVHYKPWYELVMKNVDLLNDGSQKSEILRNWIKENAPQEVLGMFEIAQIIYPEDHSKIQLSSWYNRYMTKTTIRKQAAKYLHDCEQKFGVISQKQQTI